MPADSVRHYPARTAIIPVARLLIRACAFLSLLLVATPASALPLALSPGETQNNIPAIGHVVQNSSPIDPLPGGVVSSESPVGTAVVFTREDAVTQIIYLYAGDSVKGLDVKVARGILYFDFCVPREGIGGCDSTSDPTAPDITVSLTFQFGVVGSAKTSGVYADAKLGLSGSVVDLEKGSFVAFKDLLGNQLSSHGIQFSPISLDWIPIPMPNHTNATITQPVTFPAVLLKRGRIYRFQLSAAATADGDGYIDVYRPDCSFTGCERQRVMLRDVSITVSQDTADLQNQLNNLKDVVSTLQQQMGNLVNRIDALEERLQELINSLNEHGSNRRIPPHGPPRQ